MEELFGSLTHDQLIEVWPQVRPLLERAVQHSNGEIAVDDVLGMVGNGSMFVFVMMRKGVVITALTVEFITQPGLKSMLIRLLGGSDFKTFWGKYGNAIEQFGHDCGATRMTALTRPAGARMFGQVAGMKPMYQFIAKDI
ncbi:MAG: hypothetical protein ABIT70_06635 [Sulfuriferula sp.]